MIGSDDALIHALRARLHVEPRRPMWKGDVPRAHPVAPPEAIAQTEAKLGFDLPALVRRIYAEVADGGFGPAYGIFPLVSHYRGPAQRETAVEVRDKRLYLAECPERATIARVPVLNGGHAPAASCFSPDHSRVRRVRRGPGPVAKAVRSELRLGIKGSCGCEASGKDLDAEDRL